MYHIPCNNNTVCNNNKKDQGHRCRDKKNRRGPSSFHMQDATKVFEKIGLKSGDTFLDLGCGAGDYSMHAAILVDTIGRVYALDCWPELVETLEEEAKQLGIHNLYPVVADIRREVPFDKGTIDVCMIATVLHMMDFPLQTRRVFEEVRRVLKEDGKLVVVECKKEKRFFGPLLESRISPEMLEKELVQFGLYKEDYVDLGDNYMMIFR